MSKQTKLKDPQQIRFIGKLLNTRGANYLSFFTKFCHNHTNNGNTKDCKFAKWF